MHIFSWPSALTAVTLYCCAPLLGSQDIEATLSLQLRLALRFWGTHGAEGERSIQMLLFIHISFHSLWHRPVCDCIFHTCPGEFRVTLGAVADSSFSSDVQEVIFSTRQIGDVTAGVHCGAAGGVSIPLLQSGRVRHYTGDGWPGDADCGVAAQRNLHVLRGAGSWGRRKKLGSSWFYE